MCMLLFDFGYIHVHVVIYFLCSNRESPRVLETKRTTNSSNLFTRVST